MKKKTMSTSNIEIDTSLIKFRLGTITDYNAVLDINRHVYQKFDYLPAVYHHLSHDANCYHFIAEYNGKVIGYRALYFLDRDRKHHYIALAMRTHPAYQGLGVAKKLIQVSAEMILQLKGKIMGWISTRPCTPEVKKYVLSIPKLSGHMYWNFHAYTTDVLSLSININQLESLIDHSLAVKLPLHDASILVTSKESMSRLKSYAPFIIADYWLTYTVTEQNLKYLLLKYNTYLSVDEENVCSAISTRSIIKTIDDHIRLDIWYYGEPDNSMWKCHIIKHFGDALKVLPRTKLLRCLIHTPDMISSENVQQFLKPVLGEIFTAEPFSTTRVIAYEVEVTI